MTGYDFHPEAALDMEEVWDYIAQDNPDAADKVTGEILAGIETAVAFPQQGFRRPDSLHDRFAS